MSAPWGQYCPMGNVCLRGTCILRYECRRHQGIVQRPECLPEMCTTLRACAFSGLIPSVPRVTKRLKASGILACKCQTRVVTKGLFSCKNQPFVGDPSLFWSTPWALSLLHADPVTVGVHVRFYAVWQNIQTGWLKTTHIYCLPFPEQGSGYGLSGFPAQGLTSYNQGTSWGTNALSPGHLPRSLADGTQFVVGRLRPSAPETPPFPVTWHFPRAAHSMVVSLPKASRNRSCMKSYRYYAAHSSLVCVCTEVQRRRLSEAWHQFIILNLTLG